jgi:hypothetical protein
MNLNDLKQNAVNEVNPSGFIIVDGQEVAHTKQCCHCNNHFVSVKGSGKIRGRCMLCNAITCGAPACDTHVPFEKKLEVVEGTYKGFDTNIIHLLDKYGRVL